MRSSPDCKICFCRIRATLREVSRVPRVLMKRGAGEAFPAMPGQDLIPRRQIRPQGLQRLLSDGNDPLFPAFPEHFHDPQSEIHVPVAQAHELAHPDAAGVKGFQHGPVPRSPARGLFRGVHQGEHLIHGQEGRQVLFLLGGRHDLRGTLPQDAPHLPGNERNSSGRRVSGPGTISCAPGKGGSDRRGSPNGRSSLHGNIPGGFVPAASPTLSKRIRNCSRSEP